MSLNGAGRLTILISMHYDFWTMGCVLCAFIYIYITLQTTAYCRTDYTSLMYVTYFALHYAVEIGLR